jgi:hypothetical protein
MRSSLLVGLLGAILSPWLFSQTYASMIAPTSGGKPTVPKYLVYRHFLGWVNAFSSSAQ